MISDQRDFIRVPGDLAEEDLVEDFAAEDLAGALFALGEAFLLAAAFGFAAPSAAERTESACADFVGVLALALAFAFAFAFGRADLEVDVPAIVSFTVSIALAPALATASAPSATVSPIERSTPLAPRPAAAVVFFARFAVGLATLAAALPARPSVPLLLFLP